MATDVEIRIPRETVNDDVVILVEWLHPGGAAVKSGQPLANVETSKAVIELTADGDGYLEITVPAGSEIPVGSLIGHLRAAPVGSPAPMRAPAPVPVPSSAGPDTGMPAFSRKAQALIEERGIDPAVFRGTAMVKESDVLQYLETNGAAPARPVSPAAPAAHRTAAAPDSGEGYGWLDDARKSAADRGQNVVLLGLNYVFRNWLLSLLVRIAPRGINLALHRLRGVKIGKGAYIDPTAILETAYPENITIGNDVRVTAGAIVMTHIKAPNYLRKTGAMPLTLKPVVLEDHCFIGVNSVVMPGVTVGRGAVVASGAVVVASVPPHTMVGGNPARVIKRFPAAVDPTSQER